MAMPWNWRRALKIWGSLTALICVLLYTFSPSVRGSERHVGSSKQTRDIYVPARVYRVYVGVDQDRGWRNRSSLVRIPQPPPLLLGRGDSKPVVPPDVREWANDERKVPPHLPFIPPAPPRAPPADLSRGPAQLDRGVPSVIGVQAPIGETAWLREVRLRREAKRAVRARNHASFMQLQAGGTLSPYERALYSHTAPPKPHAAPNADTFQMYVPSENGGPYHHNDEGAPLRSQYNRNGAAESFISETTSFPPRDLDVDVQNSIFRTKLSNEKVNVMNQAEVKQSAWSNTFDADPVQPPVSRAEGHKLWKDLLGAMRNRKQPKMPPEHNNAHALQLDKQSPAERPPATIPRSRAEILGRGRESRDAWMDDIDSLLRESNREPDLSNHNTLPRSDRDMISFNSEITTNFDQQQQPQNVALVHSDSDNPQSMFQPVDTRKDNQKAFASPHDAEEPMVVEQDLKNDAPPQNKYFNIRNPLIKKHSSKRKTPAIFRKIKKVGSPFFVEDSIPSEEAQDSDRVSVETKNTEISKVDVSLPVANGNNRAVRQGLSLAEYYRKTQHSSNQQVIPNGDAKANDSQVNPKVDTVPTPSETSSNATKCATIPKVQGYVMALSFFDQITTSVRRIASLQCWASQLGMTVVEPAFRVSSFGAPKSQTSVKFSELFDVVDWNELMAQNCYTSLKGWKDFFYQRSSQSLILVQLVYPQGPPKGIFGEKMDCSFNRLEEYYNKVLKPVGFTIARKVCIDFSRHPYVSSEEFKKRILGPMSPSGVTIIFNQWRGVCSGPHCPGSHLVTLTDSGCSYNSILPSLLDFLTPSEQLFRDAQSYVVQKMNAVSEYGAVMLRWERVPYNQQCIANILEQWRALVSTANMAGHRQTFLATDIGKFGSYELKKNGVPNYIFQETEKLLHSLFRKPLTFDDYEQSFVDIATTFNPGYVSLLQKTISAQARCLLLVGRGAFQEHTLHMFKQLQPQNHCYKTIARC